MSYSVLTDSATICVCLLIAFFFSSFDHGTFEEIATVSYALMGALLELKLNQKCNAPTFGSRWNICVKCYSLDQ
jgi:hypothetical protein